jgi:dephospho-CoA kinase
MSNQNIPSYQMEDYDSSDGAGASGYVENESKKRDMEEVPLSEVANIPFDSHRPSSQYNEKDPYQYLRSYSIDESKLNSKLDPRCIGLTGGIASGKSTLSSIFKEMGYVVVDADNIAHQVLTLNEVKERIRSEISDQVFDSDGNVDRKKLGDIVFNQDKSMLKVLESITHPLIANERDHQINEALSNKQNEFVFYDSPLLYETNEYKSFFTNLLIYVDEDIQIKRIMNRNGLTQTEARNRVSAQTPTHLKINSDAFQFTIDNRNDVAFLRKKANEFIVWMKSRYTSFN